MRKRRRLLSLLATLTVCLGAAQCVFASDAKDWGAQESFAVVNPVVRSPLCQTISLSGEWGFTNERAEFYRLGVGDGVWGKFVYDWSQARTINVPGAWEAQGVGELGPGKTWDPTWDCGMWDLKNVYLGRALYRRVFELPKEWQGKRIWLKVGGVSSNAYLWINAKRAAYVETFCGARKYDVTDLVNYEGENEITALVRNDTPSRLGLLVVNHHFGGFFRDVELEATPVVYVDDVWARGDVEAKAADVRVYVKAVDEEGKTSPLYDDELSPLDRDQLAAMQASGVTFAPAIRQIDKLGSIEVVLKTTDGAVVGMEKKDAELIAGENGLPQPFRFQIPIENCQLWTPESPTLYLADVTIFDKSGEAIHGWTERFGVRELKVVGDKFYLNGKPYFLRGGGDHNYDQIHLTEPADHDRFREHMTTYKAAGFNYMRFHTHSPMPEYYDVADEKGILLQPEIPYYHDVTCEGFPFNPKRDMYELFRAHRRNVSFATYSYGNEGYLGAPIDKELYSWVKKYDPDRLVIHQDGGMGNKEGAADFTTNGTNRASIINPWKSGAHDDIKVPFVAHEYLNLAIKMDPRYESRFTGARVAPVSVSAWKEKLERVGLDEKWGAACIAASEKLQGVYQKKGLEAARIDPACDGYSFWSLVDASIPQGSCVAAQGYLNPFWEPRPNGIAPVDFYRFNGPTALLLADDLPAPIIVNGMKFDAELRISHYDDKVLSTENVVWNLTSQTDGSVIASGKLPASEFKELEPGYAGLLGTVEVAIADDAVKAPTAAKFNVAIEGTDLANSWDYWIFPKREKRSLQGFAVSNGLCAQFDKLYSDVKKIDTDAPAEDGDVWIVTPGETAYYVGLTQGRKVFAITPASSTPNVSLGWWSLGTQVGTTFADSEAFAKFPNCSDMDELWFRLVRVGAPDLEAKPLGENFEPLAVGEGRDSYYLYLGQTKFGKGKALVSFALDLTQDVPEATALLDSLLDYVAGPNFDPKTDASSMTFATFETPEGVTWGFDKLVKTTQDGSQAWKTLYEESVLHLNCRQTSKDEELTWTTAPVTEIDADGSTTFAFVGGLGYWMQPQTEGFVLNVNGMPAVKFDLPAEDAKVGDKVEWTSESGGVLTFELGRVEIPGPDFFGVFCLTVPNSLLGDAGESATLSVRSLGEKSMRWFSVSEYPGLRSEQVLSTEN
jgi:hypothetical protein